MKMMYLGKPLMGRRVKALALLLLAAIIVYYLLSYMKWGREDKSAFPQPLPQKLAAVSSGGDAAWNWADNTRDIEHLLHSVPAHLLQQNKCPACFGDDICEDIHSGDLQIELPKTPTDLSHKGVYFGHWQGKDIVLKTLDNLSNHNFKMFDGFICHNQSLPEDCDISKAILNPKCLAVQESSFMLENLQQAWRIAHNGPAGLAFAVCASGELIQELSWGFDIDHDGQLNEAQVAMLYTSMVINPEAILLRFFSNLKVDLPVPEFLGACGRVVVSSHGGTPLTHYLNNAPFLQRAELALQALEIIHLFIHADPTWFILFGDMKPDNFAVNSDGQLLVIDLDGMSVIDKRLSTNFQFGQVEYTSPCNRQCIEQFVSGLWDVEAPYHAQYCEQTPHVAGMAMYALLCANILADRDMRHRFDTDGARKGDTYQGLLSNPPVSGRATVEELLEECIEESSPAGRQQAVQQLTEWLENMLQEK